MEVWWVQEDSSTLYWSTLNSSTHFSSTLFWSTPELVDTKLADTQNSSPP
jgi:hypothetical protein